ncbi:MAG: hypothetical protein QF897_01125, partial [Gammaproteobacteria bacterium]|nr:hypothetical protein [Gammaproteobacteria bacterium]
YLQRPFPVGGNSKTGEAISANEAPSSIADCGELPPYQHPIDIAVQLRRLVALQSRGLTFYIIVQLARCEAAHGLSRLHSRQLMQG